MVVDDPRLGARPPRASGPLTGPHGFPGIHGPMRTASDSRVLVRRKQEKLAKAEAALRKHVEAREDAKRLRMEQFSRESMKAVSNTAAKGLSFSIMDELRSLSVFSPPPIVELVTRCVCTLVSGDDIGDAEALEATDSGGGTVKRAHSVQGRAAAAREKLANSASSTASTRARDPVRSSDVRRGKSKSGELLSWKASLELLARPDFKWRLMNLNGMTLLDNTELVDTVAKCLDLSTLQQDRQFTIRPGRSRPSERRDLRQRIRRDLTSSLYADYAEAGVASMSPLLFEEARYTSEVAGAMLVWIQRIFAQHNRIRSAWDEATVIVEAAEARVIRAKRRVDELLDAVDELADEQDAARRSTMLLKPKIPFGTWLGLAVNLRIAESDVPQSHYDKWHSGGSRQQPRRRRSVCHV